MKRYSALFLVAAFWVVSMCAVGGVASADPRGSLVGVVTGVTGASIDVKAGGQIVHFTLDHSLSAVYLGDRRTLSSLAAIAPGMAVRVAYTDTGNGFRKAVEIDILGG